MMAERPTACTIEELVEFFLREKIIVYGAKGVKGYNEPPAITNTEFGQLRPAIPDVIGMDAQKRRIAFGVVRSERKDLDSEESLELYNVFLNHNAHLGEQASILYVLLPAALVPEFTSIITHYVHPDYWPRIVPVEAGEKGA